MKLPKFDNLRSQFFKDLGSTDTFTDADWKVIKNYYKL